LYTAMLCYEWRISIHDDRPSAG